MRERGREREREGKRGRENLNPNPHTRKKKKKKEEVLRSFIKSINDFRSVFVLDDNGSVHAAYS